ncbi:unnamed protein product [Acanthoscelides obtectus]|uniref:Uncharacterized protein n=1 Tax=Acanthoscelides obtectus TaxID=200917 RepID=A0A9P0JPE6_ACAOB|nr:unnamed protein product [Acanthoscelides obtectus]CAK1655036.1 hypothetical protein AOBTE_LOCUS18982 [Acanthoscelides obtectus]
MPKPQYTQKFRDAWLKDPSFKEWLLVIDSTLGREAKCKFCSKIITSRYADLKSHGESKKHKENASYLLLKVSTSWRGKEVRFGSFLAKKQKIRRSVIYANVRIRSKGVQQQT